MKFNDVKTWVFIALGFSILYLLYSNYKKNKAVKNSTAGNTTILSVTDDNNDCNCSGGDVQNYDLDNLRVGRNIIPTENYESNRVNSNPLAFNGFNSFDSTGSRTLSIPLQKRKTQIYIEPFNQWGGQIKDF